MVEVTRVRAVRYLTLADQLRQSVVSILVRSRGDSKDDENGSLLNYENEINDDGERRGKGEEYNA
jgi:hypothetical protein